MVAADSYQQSIVVDNKMGTNDANEKEALMGGGGSTVTNVEEHSWRTMKSVGVGAAAGLLLAIVFLASSQRGIGEWTYPQTAYDAGICTDVKGFTFYSNEDSNGGDLGNLGWGTLTPTELGAWCAQEKECLGFNTNGWMKGVLKEKSEWVSWGHEDVCNGMYIKDRCDYIPGYDFYANKDSNGEDLGQLPGLDRKTLAKVCDDEEHCSGFNTNGWMKHYIKDESEWVTWGLDDPCNGMFVKQNFDHPHHDR